MNGDGDTLIVSGADFAVYHLDSWTIGTSGLGQPEMALGEHHAGLLLGFDPPFDLRVDARLFRGGVLEPIETLVTTTSGVDDLVAIESEYGPAAGWIEDDSKISIVTWDEPAGWGTPVSLACTANCRDLLAERLDTDTVIAVWEEYASPGPNSILASQLSGASWSAPETLGAGSTIVIEALSDGRAVLGIMNGADDVELLIFESGIGWSAPVASALGPFQLQIETDDAGKAVAASGNKFAAFDGSSWSDLIEVSDEFAYNAAYRIRGQGEGFAFSLCSDTWSTSDPFMGRACLFSYAGGEFAGPEYLSEDLEGYGYVDEAARGAALNDAGDAVVTWTAPLDLEEAFSDIRLWVVMR